MFRFLFRFTGLVLITLSFLFVVYDGTKSIADQTIYISRVGPTWVNIHPNSLSAFEPAVERLAGAWIWNDVIQPYFLEQPTALVLVIIGALLVLLGSKKKPRRLRATRRADPESRSNNEIGPTIRIHFSLLRSCSSA
jgi:hypothetical protein